MPLARGAKSYKLTFRNMSHGGGGARRRNPSCCRSNTQGTVLGIADSAFTSPRELGDLLAKTPQCQECVVKQYFRYAAGRMETPRGSPDHRPDLPGFQELEFQFQADDVSLIRAREFPGEERSVRVASNH